MNITLILPGLIWPDADPALYNGLDLPHLHWLLGKGTVNVLAGQTLDQWLVRKAELGFSLPNAALTALRLPDAPTTGYWLHADPVHLHPNRSELRVIDTQTFGITPAEANALIDALNLHFAEDGLRFFPLTPYQWLLHVAEDPKLDMTPLQHVIGRSMDPHLPKGENAIRWHKLLNEIQMLMYNHPVNDQRDANGQPMLHSVWPWGGGSLPAPVAKPKSLPRWWSDAPAWLGLASYLSHSCEPTPSRAEQIVSEQQDAWVYLDGLAMPQAREDGWGWQEILREYDAVWFAPLMAALQQGQVQQVTLVYEGDHQVCETTVTRSARWQFWKRPKTLASLSSATA
ncbi:hypothetical protein [Leeia oryzae]|uniref:hypothetical protein n=1 Tax=Leeia oryzae TaxID=356662 RepID=UPI00037B2372|nr:hypothetical protein [Leeia oryzae]